MTGFAELMRQLLHDDVQLSFRDDRVDYDAPTAALTPQLLESMRRHKPELLAWLTTTDPRNQVVTRVLPGYNQQELWQKAVASGGSVVYTVSQRWYLEGEFDPSAWQEAVSWWVARHEPLRARFSSFRDADGEQPVYEVVAPSSYRVPVTDLTGLAESEKDAALQTHCGHTVQEPIRLTDAPLWRMQLFRLSPDRHVVLWMVHHIISDGTSMGIMRDELITAYEAIRSGRRPTDEATSLTQSQYARRQRRELTGGRLSELTSFWHHELDGAQLRLDFPYDFPRPAVLSGEGAIHEWGVPAQTLGRLREVARALDTTVYVVALSAYAVMLSEFTRQSDVVIPISQANRSEPGHLTAVGLLADRVPIRVRINPGDSLADLTGQVGRAVFDAMDHQAMPFSLLLGSLPEWQRPRLAFPSALFTLLDGFDSCVQLPGLSIEVRPDGPQGKARMEFYSFMTADATGLKGWLEYSTDLFTAETVAKCMDRYADLLETLSREPIRQPHTSGHQ